MKWTSKDVQWYSIKYKKPIAYSTVSDSESISIINQPNRTANELMRIFKSKQYIVSLEMKQVVQAYIDKGLGEEIIKTRSI